MSRWPAQPLTLATGAAALALWLVPRAVAALVLVFALCITASTLDEMALAHTVLPHWDEWYSLALFRTLLEGGDLVRGMASLHNEHRILFPRLVLFSDYLFFHGLGIANTVAIVLIQVLEAALLVGLIARAGVGWVSRAALTGVVLALAFSLRQCENFFWGFQVQFVGVFACASLSITLFVAGLAPQAGGTRAAGLLCAAFGLAAVAAFTMSNGLLCGFVLVVLACLARAARAIISAAAGVAVLLCVAFATGYHLAPGHEGLSASLYRPLRVLTYTAAYLGDFIDNGTLAAAVAFGACGLAGLAGLVFLVASGRDRDPIRLTLLGLGLFAAGSAGLTALGRSGDGLGGAMASRYATGSALFWAALLVAAWSLPGRSGSRIVVRSLVCTASAVLLWQCWVAQSFYLTYQTQAAARIGLVEDELVQGLYDEPALQALDEPADMMRTILPFLQQRGLSIFAGRDAGLLGHPLSEAGRLGPTRCAGSFELAASSPALGVDGVTVTGTSGVSTRLGTPARIYIADAEGRVVGLGRTGFGLEPWAGAARAAPGSALTAYALLGSGRLCALGTTLVSLAATAGSEGDTGQPGRFAASR